MANKSTGPRTPQGKTRSSQNATKHQVFVHRVLQDEQNAAALLNDGICSDLRISGVLEFKIARDLVQNELEGDRIEKFAVREFEKAPLLANCDVAEFDSQHAPTLRPPIPKEKEGQEGYRTRLRPKFCAMFLVNLKEKIEKRGLWPEEDLEFLESIYGNEITILGQLIVAYYNAVNAGEDSEKGSEMTAKRKKTEHQGRILKVMEQEIAWQKARIGLEDCREAIEHAAEWVVLPPDHILDKIEKYRTASARKRSRLLADLETIRRLKAGT